MLTPSRALRLNADSGKPLPIVDELAGLYEFGFQPRYGQTVMIAGRSGSQKSGFAMWYADRMGLETLYFSGDMSPFTASSRIASMRYGVSTDEVEAILARRDMQTRDLVKAMNGSRIQFSFGSPIRWEQIDEELTAYVEVYNRYPELVVFDNLMDFEGGESDYSAQMETMQFITEFTRETECTTFTMHHASDKAIDPKRPWKPPARNDIKNGLAEKPELVLGVALDNTVNDFNIAVLKQRMGAQDATGEHYVTLRAQPELTRFHKPGFVIPSNN